MKLQLLGIGLQSILTIPIKGTDSIISLSALARFLEVPRSTLHDHIQAVGYEQAIREAAIAKRKKKLTT